MGVPGFFAWLWRKYKGTRFVFEKEKLSKTKDKDLIKKLKHLDYLFLDANSLVHPVCFKVLADNPNLTNLDKLEAKMRECEALGYQRFFSDIEKLFSFSNVKFL